MFINDHDLMNDKMMLNRYAISINIDRGLAKAGSLKHSTQLNSTRVYPARLRGAGIITDRRTSVCL